MTTATTSCFSSNGLDMLGVDGVSRFSGENKTISVAKWAQDIEDNAEIFGWSNLQKLVIARKTLVGTAAMWLSSEKPYKSYNELKAALQKEFPVTTNVKEMHEIMAKRKKSKQETCYQYMLEMKELAKRAKFPDYVGCSYIIDGIQDNETNKIILYGATTYPQLKEKLALYEQLKAKTVKEEKPERPATRRFTEHKKRCFNCGEDSHVASECKNGIKCFKCNDFGHIGRNCNQDGGISNSMSLVKQSPTYATTSRGGASSGTAQPQQQWRRSLFASATNQSATLDDLAVNRMQDERPEESTQRPLTEMEDESRLILQVNKFTSVENGKRPMKLVEVNAVTINSLVDSGCDVNLISQKCVSLLKVIVFEDNLKLSGLGKKTVYSLGKVCMDIKIDDINYKNVLFHIVDNDVIPFNMILGQEMLHQLTVIMKEGRVLLLNDKDDNWMCKLCCFSDFPAEVGFIQNPALKQRVLLCVQTYNPQKVVEAPIQLKFVLRDDIPVSQRPRRLSLVEQKVVEDCVSEWLEAGIIRVSFSEYSSPVVLVKRKDGNIRVCIDYRLLNRKIVRDEYPLPVIDDLIDKLLEGRVFSILDLKNGFFHLRVSEECIPYTAFVTHEGQYEFLRAPFGLSVCPKYFMRYVSIVFRELVAKNIMVIFIDDILILAKDEEEAVERLEIVLQVASQNGLQINWKKANLITKEVEYLGHVVKNGTIKPSPGKTDAVLMFPEPKDAKALHSFIGLTSYFRKYIENYAIIAKPLTDLLKKNESFRFEEEQRAAFKYLKDKMASGPVLKIYYPKLKTELHTDASKVGYSAILLQHHPDTGLHPVHYMSCKTNDAESRYTSYELEALAIIEGVKKFRHYLYGIHFKIVTDCQAFESTLKKKDLIPKVARWVMFLNEYDFEVEHRPGSKMSHVDALSRYPFVGLITLHDKIQMAQDQDEGLQAIKQILENKSYKDFWMENGLLYKGNEKLLVIPKSMENDIIRKVHGNGHFSNKKMKEMINKEYYLKNLDKKIEDFIVTCIPCLLATKKEGKQEGYLNPIEKGSIPLDTIHLDHVGPLTQTSKQYNHILTVIDAFTKYVWLFPTKSTTSRETLNKLQIYQQVFGNPSRIITDKGTAFTSHEFLEYCREENIQHITITTGVPRGNGQVERIHRIIIPLLIKLSIEDSGQWYKHVSRVQRAINSTYQRSINTSPFELLVGTKMKVKEDVKLHDLLKEEEIQMYGEEREERRKQAKAQIAKVQEENIHTYNKKRKQSIKYKDGDMVVSKRTQFGPGLKLKPKYFGPYKVTKVKRNDRYDLEKVDISTEGPFKTSSCADHMKPWVPSGIDPE